MPVQQLSDATREQRLCARPLAIVAFHAAWCGRCLIFERRFVRLSEEYPHVAFLLCDVEESPELTARVQPPELPYFGLFRDGEPVGGFHSTDEARVREEVERAFGPRPTA